MVVSYLELLGQFEQCLRVERNLSPRTIKAYQYDLERFYAYLAGRRGAGPSLAAIDAEKIRTYLNYLQTELSYKSTTLARVVASLRAFFDFAVAREALEASPAAQIHTPKQPKRLPIFLVPQELVRLLEAPDADTWQGRRDRAIMTTMTFTGMRLSELVGINLKDLDLNNRVVRVLGKGRKERIIPLNEMVIDALNHYLEVRPIGEERALFVNRNRIPGRLSGRGVENIVHNHLLKAGIFKDKVSPHKLRHTFATLLHANEVDLIEIQNLMGHASIASTQIYTHTSNAKLRLAVKKLENVLD